jgi:hypothetical protein
MTYQGPATLVAPGLAIAVVADLRVEHQILESIDGNGRVVRERGLKEWLGGIQSDDGSFWEILNASPKLVLPGGREGAFFTHLPTAEMLDEGSVKIQGAGPAPFGDAADEATA